MTNLTVVPNESNIYCLYMIFIFGQSRTFDIRQIGKCIYLTNGRSHIGSITKKRNLGSSFTFAAPYISCTNRTLRQVRCPRNRFIGSKGIASCTHLPDRHDNNIIVDFHLLYFIFISAFFLSLCVVYCSETIWMSNGQCFPVAVCILFVSCHKWKIDRNNVYIECEVGSAT